MAGIRLLRISVWALIVYWLRRPSPLWWSCTGNNNFIQNKQDYYPVFISPGCFFSELKSYSSILSILCSRASVHCRISFSQDTMVLLLTSNSSIDFYCFPTALKRKGKCASCFSLWDNTLVWFTTPDCLLLKLWLRTQAESSDSP